MTGRAVRPARRVQARCRRAHVPLAVGAAATLIAAAALLGLAGVSDDHAGGPRRVSAGVVDGAGAGGLAHPAAAARPLTTATGLPPIDPNPYGGPISVGAPLATATISPDAIAADNAWGLAALPAPEPRHSDGEMVVDMTRDGARILTQASGKGWVRRLPDGAIVADLGAAGGSYGAQRISPDGSVLATANEPATGFVTIRDMSTGALLREHRGGQQVRALTFAGRGARLAAVRSDRVLNIWDVATGRLDTNAQIRPGGICCPVMDVRPDGDELAVGIDREVIRIDPATGAETSSRSVPRGWISGLSYSPDGRLIAVIARLEYGSAPMPFEASIWEGTSRIGVFEYVDRWSSAAVWSADSRMLAVAGTDGLGAAAQHGDLWLWREGGGAAVRIASETNHGVVGMDWSPAGPLLAYSMRQVYLSDGTYPGSIHVYDAATGHESALVPGFQLPRFSPDGSLLIATGDASADSALAFFAVDPAAPTPTPTATATSSNRDGAVFLPGLTVSR